MELAGSDYLKFACVRLSGAVTSSVGVCCISTSAVETSSIGSSPV